MKYVGLILVGWQLSIVEEFLLLTWQPWVWISTLPKYFCWIFEHRDPSNKDAAQVIERHQVESLMHQIWADLAFSSPNNLFGVCASCPWDNRVLEATDHA